MLFPFLNQSYYEITTAFNLTWASAGRSITLARQIDLIILYTLQQLKHLVK